MAAAPGETSAAASLAARRPVAVTVTALAFALVGWLSWRELPIDLLPDLRSPTIVVAVSSGDRPPTEMERLYGEQVEQRLFTVRGIRDVQQVARTGRLIATVRFDWDADMDYALVEVQKAVNPVAADAEVDDVLVRHLDPRQAPVMTLGLLAEDEGPDLAELRRLARRQLAPAMEELPDVAEVRVLGGRDLEVQVQVDRYRLEAFGITLNALETRLAAENLDLDAGTLEDGGAVWLVRGIARFRDARDVERVVVRYRTRREGGRMTRQPIRVADVADVVVTHAEIDHLVRVEGVEGVGLQVFKEAGANTVAVSRTVRNALESLERDLPNVRMSMVNDDAALIENAMDDLMNAALIGIALAIVVLALFLRSLGATIVVASAVPVSLFVAVFAMRLADHSLNIITLAGLALGAGMLVDNAIVVVESIHRRHRPGADAADTAARGASEVAGAIAASTLTTCVVFLPVLFVQGLAARLVEGIAFTVVASLGASLAVAMLLIPALSRWLLPRTSSSTGDEAGENPHLPEADDEAPGMAADTRQAGAGGGPPLGRAFRATETLVLRLLRLRWAVVPAAVLAAAFAVRVLLGLGSELLPPSDPRQFSIRVVGPAGQQVEATANLIATLEAAVRQTAGEHLEAIQAEVGRLPEDDRMVTTELTEENTARLLVRLSPDGPTGGEIVAALSPRFADLPGTEIEWEVGASALAEALGSTGPPIVIEMASQSLPDLRESANELRHALAARPEVWNVRSSFEGGPPELRVELDRAMADGLGVDLQTVARVLESALDGRRVTLLSTGDEERHVVLTLPQPRPEELANLRFTADGGALLALGQVARFEPTEGAREVFRRDQRRVAQVTARIAAGGDYPAAVAAAREAIDAVDPPPGMVVRLAGEEEEREQAVSELRWAGLLAIVLVLMVLAGTFESLLQPLTVLFSIPLALVGVSFTLGPIGDPVGVMALLGLIVLSGVAVNDAVLLLATARRLMAAGLRRRAALARAAAIRLRPILMTTLTTVLVLLPLAVGGGEAAELRGPMAWTIIGGILTSTVGSLLVLPCVYLILDSVRLARRRPASA